uniref:Ubiquinol-cytochrome c reductase complex assembly factor 5 n=1 Tax=Podarcis muralis TaxID=64176 RepID=A0A670IPA5_PODMU
MLVKHKIKLLLNMVPGKQRFGVYRFLPFFFILGGAMEWFMIRVRIGQETFCKYFHKVFYERQWERLISNFSAVGQKVLRSEISLTLLPQLKL